MTEASSVDRNDDGLGLSPGLETTPVRASGRAVPRRAVFAGYTMPQLLVGAALLLALIWAMWISKAVMAEKPQHIVKADLSRIVGEYVQAQARSATPPDQVQAQMRTFMAALDTELQRRGAAGQVVLVGEAVLSKSVPDITGEVAKAVYSTGVRVPQPASPAQMGAMMRGQAPTAPVAAPVAVAPEVTQIPTGAPAPSPFGAVGMDTAQAVPAPAPDLSAAGASVSTFGGPSGQ
ncbi:MULTISPECIES: TrbI F-type domain-containing protein [Sphingomonadaceae]|jgi:hypothetical protein|uniref:Type-F conjugative transfer system protein (TrbI_Ftype) n=1 Tax=Sphingomonas abaci TaxID=237611 RepID=A0A7W7ANJ8_9SPHN|nr:MULTISPECIES: TrbI F-type domain-containing protein [Sphingomonadaceae]MBB3588680.1 hypothetical protein [Sphingomonas sp. BK481]MBB4619272.1 hypothetical protein [Sphingomonas abaci]MBS86567.1 hypothetical protein [Sphingobium sp.]